MSYMARKIKVPQSRYVVAATLVADMSFRIGFLCYLRVAIAAPFLTTLLRAARSASDIEWTLYYDISPSALRTIETFVAASAVETGCGARIVYYLPVTVRLGHTHSVNIIASIMSLQSRLYVVREFFGSFDSYCKERLPKHSIVNSYIQTDK